MSSAGLWSRLPSLYTLSWPCLLVTSMRPSGAKASAVGAGTLAPRPSVKPAGTAGITGPAKSKHAKNPANRARVMGANARPGISRAPRTDSTSRSDYGSRPGGSTYATWLYVVDHEAHRGWYFGLPRDP